MTTDVPLGTVANSPVVDVLLLPAVLRFKAYTPGGKIPPVVALVTSYLTMVPL